MGKLIHLKLSDKIKNAENDYDRVKFTIELNKYKIESWKWGQVDFYKERNIELKKLLERL